MKKTKNKRLLLLICIYFVITILLPGCTTEDERQQLVQNIVEKLELLKHLNFWEDILEFDTIGKELLGVKMSWDRSYPKLYPKESL